LPARSKNPAPGAPHAPPHHPRTRRHGHLHRRVPHHLPRRPPPAPRNLIPTTRTQSAPEAANPNQKIREELTVELGKSFLQVGVIGLLGAMLTFRIERHRITMQAKEQLLSSLNTTYSKVKQIRRKIKHFNRDYAKLRPALSNLQLEIEVLRKNIDSSNVFRDKDRKRLFEAVGRMDEYLNEVIKSDQPNTHEFLNSRPSRFHREFADQYGTALNIIRAGLLGRLAKRLWNPPSEPEKTSASQSTSSPQLTSDAPANSGVR
jgi:hypothetical protein